MWQFRSVSAFFLFWFWVWFWFWWITFRLAFRPFGGAPENSILMMHNQTILLYFSNCSHSPFCPCRAVDFFAFYYSNLHPIPKEILSCCIHHWPQCLAVNKHVVCIHLQSIHSHMFCKMSLAWTLHLVQIGQLFTSFTSLITFNTFLRTILLDVQTHHTVFINISFIILMLRKMCTSKFDPETNSRWQFLQQ